MQTELIKKRRPRRKRWRRNGEKRRGTYVWPNLFTTANLFSGFFGIVSSINGDFEVAAVAILASCVFDILDGKIARLTGGTSRFGVEYDSLADLVAFGVGPSLLMYLLALRPYGRVGWLAAFVFMACGALRLARFNVQVETTNKNFFVGLPIPGGASMLATTVLFMRQMEINVHSPLIGTVLLVTTFGLGFFMISTMPYNSFKEMEHIKARPSFVIFGVIVLVSVVAAAYQIMLFLLLTIYTASGPLRWLTWMIQGKRGGLEPSPQRIEDVPQVNVAEERKPVAELVKSEKRPVNEGGMNAKNNK